MKNHENDRLAKAFDHMVEQVGDALHDAEEALAPTVDEMVHNAQVLTREIYALTQEEVEMLGDTLRRDLHKANEYVSQEGKELRDWFNFDLELIEDRFGELIARAADKTWLEFRQFGGEDYQASIYRSGEVCTPGTFSCRACDNQIQLSRSATLPPCPVCDRREFFRVIG